MLSSEGLNDFTAIGAWDDFSALRFPAFVRPREVDGTTPALVHTPGDVEREVGAFVLDGWRPDELLVVEFEDLADSDGMYEKYSAFVIGERVVPVSLDVGHHWVLRRHAAESGAHFAEASYRYVADNPHESQLTEIFRKSHTQFGRIDYSMKGDRVQTWEINTLPHAQAAPSIRSPARGAPCVGRAPPRPHQSSVFPCLARACGSDSQEPPDPPGVRRRDIGRRSRGDGSPRRDARAGPTWGRPFGGPRDPAPLQAPS